MLTSLTLLALFSLATGVALVARKLRVPYTVALVVAGLVLGAGHIFKPPALTKELLFAVFLLGLIIQAAFSIPSEELWKNKLVVSFLALP
jgi:CPA1 family monovalent cation:H+ antiporter